MTNELEEQVGKSGPDTWSGKTCRAHSVRRESGTEKTTEEKISRRSSRKSSGSSTKTHPMFLYLVGGGWPKSGCIMGYGSDGCPFSIAYRVHDAQFWGATQYADGRMLFCGTPQRRKRIALVADFGGLSAGEICFERKGLSGYSDKSSEEREGTAGNTEGSSVKAIKDGVVFSAGFCTEHSADSHGIGYEEEKSPTLRAGTVPGAVVLCDQGGQRMDVTDGITTTLRAESNHPPIVFGIGGYNSKGMLSNNPKAGIYKADTSRTLDENGGNPGCNQGGMVVLEGNGARPSHQGDGFCESDVMYTLNATEVHAVLKSPEPTLIEMTSTKNTIVEDGKCPTLTARMGTGGNQVNAVFVENHPADGRCDVRNDGVCQTLTGRMGTGGNNVPLCMDVGMFSVQEDCSNPLLARQFKDPPVVSQGILRRLTPMDCERLQGFPDGWTDIGPWTDSKGKLHKESSDSARYKALGNSICIPFWFYLLRRIAAQYERPATLGSLFDGIGGFPLAWERCNGKGTAIWASEIEDFPIAVTKHHFPE